MGHQITAMFEWMKHTDNTLNARLNDDVYSDDVPGEAEVNKKKIIIVELISMIFKFVFLEINY
jgi:hypothetical protein